MNPEKRETLLLLGFAAFVFGLIWLASVVPPMGPMVQIAESFEDEEPEPAFPSVLPLLGALVVLNGAVALVIAVIRWKNEKKEDP